MEQPSGIELPIVSPARCELRAVIRFLTAKGGTNVEIHRQLCEVYGPLCMDLKNVRKWVKAFKAGRTDIHDEQRSGRPSVSEETIAQVEKELLEDPRVTVRALYERIPNVSKTTIDKILREHLHYRKVRSKWVPDIPTEGHKWEPAEEARDFVKRYTEDEDGTSSPSPEMPAEDSKRQRVEAVCEFLERCAEQSSSKT